jgi:hypothetical protein
MKLVVKRKGDEPTPQEIEAQNKRAREFAVRKGLIIGNDAHVGKEGAKYIDASTGKELVGGNSSLPYGTITDIRQIPLDVTDKDISYDEKNMPYYVDKTSGDFKYIHPDIARSSRFNPSRGKYDLAGRLTPNNLISLR